MESQSMIYIVSEFASQGEIFGKYSVFYDILMISNQIRIS